MKCLLICLLLGLSLMATGQLHDIKLNLVKGTDYYQNTLSSVVVDQTIQGTKTKSTIHFRGRLRFHVKNFRDSVYDMEVRYEDLAMEMRSPYQVLHLDAKDSSGQAASRIFASMCNRPFAMSITNRGRIVNLEIKTVFDHLLDSFPELPITVKKELVAQLEQNFGEQAFIYNFEMLMAVYPERPVEMNGAWTVNTNLNAVYKISCQSRYVLRSETGEQYLVEGTSAVQMEPSTGYMDMNGIPTKYDLKGQLRHLIQVDKSTGWIVSSEYTQKLEGEIEIGDCEQIPGGMVMPVVYHCVTNVSNK